MDMIWQALQVMIYGLLGIFLVMGIIILALNLLNLVFTKPDKKKQEKDAE